MGGEERKSLQLRENGGHFAQLGKSADARILHGVKCRRKWYPPRDMSLSSVHTAQNRRPTLEAEPFPKRQCPGHSIKHCQEECAKDVETMICFNDDICQQVYPNHRALLSASPSTTAQSNPLQSICLHYHASRACREAPGLSPKNELSKDAQAQTRGSECKCKPPEAMEVRPLVMQPKCGQHWQLAHGSDTKNSPRTI